MTTISHCTAALLAGLSMLAATGAAAQTRAAPPGGMCGGLAGFQCPAGEQCVMTGPPHPDQAGLCRPAPPPAARSRTLCAQVFKPVCGVDGATYANACTSRARGVAVAYDGECDAAPPRSLARAQHVCPTLDRPVCGRDRLTYPNRCVARLNGVAVSYGGLCRSADAQGAPQGDDAEPASRSPPPPSRTPPSRPRYGERD